MMTVRVRLRLRVSPKPKPKPKPKPNLHHDDEGDVEDAREDLAWGRGRGRGGVRDRVRD